MSYALGKEIKKRYESLKSKRSNWEDTWYDCAMYVMPEKKDVYDWLNKTKGDHKNLQMYEDSAQHYNELLASALHSMLTNGATQWVDLVIGDPELDKNPNVRGYLQKVVRKLHSILNNSNFQTEIHEVYLDLGCFGTGVLRVEDDEDDYIKFHSRPIYEIYIDENYKGDVDTVFTVYKLTIRAAFQQYGKEAFLDEGERLAKDVNQEIEVIHAVLPREDVMSVKRKNFAKKKPFASIHVLAHGDRCIVLKESGFDEFPYMIPRWIKISGEKYGRSPAMKKMTSIKMANQMMKTTVRAGQKAVDPPLAVPDDGYLGRVKTTPGGLTPYRSGTQDKIYPIETGARPDIGNDMVDRILMGIRQGFFIDLLQLQQGPQMTATEVNARVQDQLRLLGPILGRLHSELLKPLIARILRIMDTRNLMPEDMPEELKDIEPQIVYSSQIARAQKLGEIENLNRYMGALAGVTQMNPDAGDVVDTDQYARLAASYMSIPEELFRKPEALKEFREAKAQANQDAADAQNNLATAQAAKSAADAASTLQPLGA